MYPINEIWRLLDPKQRAEFLLLQVVSLLMALSTLAGIAAVVPFFAVLGDPQRIGSSALLSLLYREFGFSDAHTFLVGLGIACFGVIVLANLINWIGSLAMSRFAHQVGNDFSAALFNDYLHRDSQFHLCCHSSELLNNVGWESLRGTTGILQFYFILCTNLATGVLIIGSLMIVNPTIAIVTLLGLGATYAVIYLFARRRLTRNGQLETRHLHERTKIATESFGAVKDITLLRGQEYFRERFEYACESLSRVALNTQAIGQSPRYILECIVVAGLVGTALYLVEQGGRDGGAWLAQLTYLGFASYRLLPALQQIFSSVVRIRADRTAFTRIAADLQRARTVQPVPARQPQWSGRPYRDIQLDGVGFSYSPERPAGLHEATVRIAAGTTVALVGPSGAGKTTLAELILGLLEPTSGSIAVDGERLDRFNRADWQATIAYVPQRIFIFDATLAENIAVAVGLEQIDASRLHNAIRLAQLEPLVATFPNGPREMLGEHGARLSGGQRQRIGIARALYRDASLLILDEATNALDRMTENEIMATLEGLRGERTIILIAHRLTAALRCDLVVEIEKGTVVDSYSHDEFMRRSERAGLALQSRR
jgi:ABC-type multidrug transport system fused ATPase/permease subunit